MADEQKANVGEIILRLKTLEDNIKKIDSDLYKGNGKSPLIVRMEAVELNLEAQTTLIRQEANANREFRKTMYADIQELKTSDAFQKGKDAAENKNMHHQVKTHHLIIGVVAMVIAPIIAEFIIHILHL